MKADYTLGHKLLTNFKELYSHREGSLQQNLWEIGNKNYKSWKLKENIPPSNPVESRNYFEPNENRNIKSQPFGCD